MKSYPYRPQRGLMVAGAVFFAVCANFFIQETLAAERGLSIMHMMDLGPAAARWCFAGFALTCSLATLVSILGLFAPTRTLTLSDAGISLPTGLFGRRQRDVKWSEVRGLSETEVAGTQLLVLELASGRVSVTNRMLDAAAYGDVRKTILALAPRNS